MNSFKISIIIPAFNEQDNIKILTEKLLTVLSKYSVYEIIFIDDGSTDKTLEYIQDLSEKNSHIKYLSFSRNFGHQYALKAGFDHAAGDCVISMDADLQHPPELIDQMIQKWQEGYEIISAKRAGKSNLSIFKRKSAAIFYGLLNYISDIDLEKGAPDFRLMDKSVVEVFRRIGESSLFLRGMVPWVGFKQCCIQYSQNDRLFGESKYSFWKMLLFALDGITSFSVRPLRLATILGLLLSMSSILYALYAVYSYFFTNNVITGWASIISSILFIGGLQLLILGIFGEYLGKLVIESKKRPIYIIRKKKL